MTPPKRGKKYKEIVERGCSIEQDHNGDYSCIHEYDWTCDHCPVNVESWKEKAKEVMG